MNELFSVPGSFELGCNYWASHAGTAMWSDWKPEVVERDFARLASKGIQVLRVFPLWPDFQPIHLLRGYAGKPVEYRFGEEALSDDAEGRAGVSKEAITRFEELVRLAERYEMKLIVGLITGWMSGRLFVPPALEGRNPLTDPVAIQWEVRFVRYFVQRFKQSQTIAAWDLGNECNCMGTVPSQEAAWSWVSSITYAIKAVDPTRPVISGMHSLKPAGNWTIQDQAEITDILTTHPYTSPTYGSDQDPANTMRSILHPTAQTLYYRGIGGKPCFVEETGTFGPMYASEEVTADYAYSSIFSVWAHDGRGFMWWCANDQKHLKQAPYDWLAVERELGLLTVEGKPKPVLEKMHQFASFLNDFPYETLPERIIDGVCIITEGQDSWAAAYSTFVLAKQAGLDIEFQAASQPLKDSKLYLMPSTQGTFSRTISGRRMEELLEKVKQGAVLYISTDGGVFSSFAELAGIRVHSRERSTAADFVTISHHGQENTQLELKGTFKLNTEQLTADSIGMDQAGNLAYSCASYGKGHIFFLSYPLETYVHGKPSIFHGAKAKPYWKIYQQLKEHYVSKKVIGCNQPSIGVTEHPCGNQERVIVAINYEPEAMDAQFSFTGSWKLSRIVYGSELWDSERNETGSAIQIKIPKNDAFVFIIRTLSGG